MSAQYDHNRFLSDLAASNAREAMYAAERAAVQAGMKSDIAEGLGYVLVFSGAFFAVLVVWILVQYPKAVRRGEEVRREVAAKIAAEEARKIAADAVNVEILKTLQASAGTPDKV